MGLHYFKWKKSRMFYLNQHENLSSWSNGLLLGVKTHCSFTVKLVQLSCWRNNYAITHQYEEACHQWHKITKSTSITYRKQQIDPILVSSFIGKQKILHAFQFQQDECWMLYQVNYRVASEANTCSSIPQTHLYAWNNYYTPVVKISSKSILLKLKTLQKLQKFQKIQ